MKSETHLWRCIYDHANSQRGRLQSEVKAADMSRATEGRVSEALLNKWRYKPTLPRREQLAAIQDGLGVPYMDMLEAALTDRGWLPAATRGESLGQGVDKLKAFWREQQRDGSGPTDSGDERGDETA